MSTTRTAPTTGRLNMRPPNMTQQEYDAYVEQYRKEQMAENQRLSVQNEQNEQRLKQLFAIHGVMGGCEGINFKEQRHLDGCNALTKYGWGLVESIKKLAYLTDNGVSPTPVRKLEDIVNLQLLPPAFLKALQESAPTQATNVANATLEKSANAPTTNLPPKKDDTWIYASVGAGLVVLAIVLVFVFKK